MKGNLQTLKKKNIRSTSHSPSRSLGSDYHNADYHTNSAESSDEAKVK